jgi:hypothetical protein
MPLVLDCIALYWESSGDICDIYFHDRLRLWFLHFLAHTAC